jgi:hypothetical protein
MRRTLFLVVLCFPFIVYVALSKRRRRKKAEAIEFISGDDTCDSSSSSSSNPGAPSLDFIANDPDSYGRSLYRTDAEPMDSIHVTAGEILEKHNYFEPSAEKKSRGELLFYITPWNAKGYEYSLELAPKIDWLVPVWFQVRGGLELTGLQDIDEGWLMSMRGASVVCVKKEHGSKEISNTPEECSSRLNILPRVSVETHLKCNVHSGSLDDRSDDCVVLAVKLESLKRKHNFDGFTIELSLSNWEAAIVLTRTLSRLGCKVVFVLPPLESQEGDYSEWASFLNAIAPGVDRFSVMTYDKNKMKGEPNAPVPWVMGIMSGLSRVPAMRKKMLVGIPLYGWRGSDALTGDSVVEWLRVSRDPEKTLGDGDVEIVWDDGAKEHLWISQPRSRRAMGASSAIIGSYPTPAFINLRLALADNESLGIAGAALWELGQAMPLLLNCF